MKWSGRGKRAAVNGEGEVFFFFVVVVDAGATLRVR